MSKICFTRRASRSAPEHRITIEQLEDKTWSVQVSRADVLQQSVPADALPQALAFAAIFMGEHGIQNRTWSIDHRRPV